MKIFWREGRPLTSAELARLAGDGRWSGSYVQKMLTGLQKHGYVEVCGVEQDKNHYLRQFRACVSREDYVTELVEREELDAAAIARVAAALARKTRSPGKGGRDLAEQLERMLREYESGGGEE